MDDSLQMRVFGWATRKGWNDEDIPVPQQIALAHSELSEALECWRNSEPIIWMDGTKPCGIASEYADTVIRLLHYSEILGFNLLEMVELKMMYNETREHRHGGKVG